MGKVVLAFLFFISASCLAIREARPLPAGDPRRPEPVPVAVSRAVRDPVPPVVTSFGGEVETSSGARSRAG